MSLREEGFHRMLNLDLEYSNRVDQGFLVLSSYPISSMALVHLLAKILGSLNFGQGMGVSFNFNLTFQR